MAKLGLPLCLEFFKLVHFRDVVLFAKNGLKNDQLIQPFGTGLLSSFYSLHMQSSHVCSILGARDGFLFPMHRGSVSENEGNPAIGKTFDWSNFEANHPIFSVSVMCVCGAIIKPNGQLSRTPVALVPAKFIANCRLPPRFPFVPALQSCHRQCVCLHRERGGPLK